jgi:hypothetical protein
MDLVWRKSNASSDHGDCVELAWPVTGAALRDSKNTTGPMLIIPTEAVASLVTTLKRG